MHHHTLPSWLLVLAWNNRIWHPCVASSRFRVLFLDLWLATPRSRDLIPGAGWRNTSERWFCHRHWHHPSPRHHHLLPAHWNTFLAYLPTFAFTISPTSFPLDSYSDLLKMQPDQAVPLVKVLHLLSRLLGERPKSIVLPTRSFMLCLCLSFWDQLPHLSPLCLSFTSLESVSCACSKHRAFGNAIPLPGKVFSFFFFN